MRCYFIMYDCVLKKPGCVLLQGAGGGTVPTELFHKYFPGETWLLAPTYDMKLYPVTEQMLPKLSAITKEKT